MAGAFPISGAIDPQAFPFLLVDLHHNGATGSLKVEGPSYQKALYFRGGRILFGSSNDPRDQLGAILIETGTLTPEQLEEANSKVGPGSPLAKVLSETGFVSQRELGEAARAKVERILSDVIAYTAGNFEFEDGVLPKGAVDLKLSTEKVLLAAVRRVSDRGFVLRHLGGLDVVLAPVAEVKGRFPEVEADAADLLGRIDGRSSLKDAAAGTRLDEFEAAKLACTLLFLGRVRRADARMVEPVPVPFVPAAEQSGEIDLSDTAREAFTGPAPEVPIPTFDPPVPTFPPPSVAAVAAPPAAPAPAPAAEPELGIFVPDDVRSAPASAAAGPVLAEAEPAPIFVADPEPPSLAAPPPMAPKPSFTPAPPVVPPLPLVPPPAPATPAVTFTPPPAERAVTAPPAAAPNTAPYIPSRTPDLSIPPAPAGVGPSKREAREWKPPARSGATPPPSRPGRAPEAEPEVPLSPPARPSKDDLAALDALLNAKGLEGPLQPLEKPSAERWSPQFGAGRQAGARPVPAPRSHARAALVALTVVAAATAALWYFVLRPQSGASAAVASGIRPRDVGHASPGATASQTAAAALPGTGAASPAATGTDAAEAITSPPAVASRPSAAGTAPPVATPAARPATAVPRVATPPPVAATPAPRVEPAAGGVREARALMAKGDLSRAARLFAGHLDTAPAGTVSVQLLVACSGETVQKAVTNVSSPELFIVPVKFQGRDCFRLCWGLYPSATQAATAARALPDYFRKGGATPRVMTAAELRP